MMTETTLVLGESLLLFAFGAPAIHFATVKVVLKKQATAGAFTGSRLDRSATTRNWTFKNGFTVAAPIFPFEGCFTFLTSFNGHCFLLQNLKWFTHLCGSQVIS